MILVYARKASKPQQLDQLIWKSIQKLDSHVKSVMSSSQIELFTKGINATSTTQNSVKNNLRKTSVNIATNHS